MAIATPKRKVTMGRRDGQIEIEHGGGGGDVCTAGERVNAASGCPSWGRVWINGEDTGSTTGLGFWIDTGSINCEIGFGFVWRLQVTAELSVLGSEMGTADWAHGRAEDGRRRESSMARDNCDNCIGDKERLRQR
ncbi:hypothetical protein M0R45_010181 [Rubus argutus]|uniref:Uncharacterized protein n=1 Tax=Rubus argutus TaxID=59490 RepID=A0AAW1Y8Q1_RUBAR